MQHCRTIVLNCLIPWIERTHGTIEDNCSTMIGFAARKLQNSNLDPDVSCWEQRSRALQRCNLTRDRVEPECRFTLPIPAFLSRRDRTDSLHRWESLHLLHEGSQYCLRCVRPKQFCIAGRTPRSIFALARHRKHSSPRIVPRSVLR